MEHDDVQLELKTAKQLYGVSYGELLKKYRKLQDEQRKLPTKFSEAEKFEDHLLNTGNLKHQSIELWRDALATSDAIKSDTDHYSAHMQLYSADSFLSERGFQRITDALRENYVKASVDFNDLKKVKGNIIALAESAERLVRAFESDETNCRRLLERQSKIIGIQ